MDYIKMHKERLAEETLRRQENDLLLFREFLMENDISTGDLFNQPQNWENITHELIEEFIDWQLKKGYAVESINIRLSTVRLYSRLAFRSGSMTSDQYLKIKEIIGFSRRDEKRIDRIRIARGIDTRIGHKKPEAIYLNDKQITILKNCQDTPQGRRDALLICLMIDHGLRVGEVAGLQVKDFDLKAGELHFYRQKVDKEQVHELSDDTIKAARNYFEHEAPEIGLIFKRSRKDGSLIGQGISTRAIHQRVKVLGKRIGIDNLSPMDLRHTWATNHKDCSLDWLLEAGGWNSPDSAMRYIKPDEIL